MYKLYALSLSTSSLSVIILAKPLEKVIKCSLLPASTTQQLGILEPQA